MEALIATSRSINQDKLIERENKRKYSNHLLKVGSIVNQKANPFLQQIKETEKMTQTLYKSKSAAKNFKVQQSILERKRQNRILLQKIWKVNSNIKTERPLQQRNLEHISGSNWYYKKKQAQAIKEENKRIASNLINKRTDVKEYKKKIGQEIKQYLDLKDKIRKYKYTPAQKKPQRCKSERKIMYIKEQKIEELKHSKLINKTKKSEGSEEEEIATQIQPERKEEQAQQIMMLEKEFM